MKGDVQQLNLFNFGKENFVIDKPIRLIELFSGIGSQAKALEMLGVPFEHWKTCEWAVNSIKGYNAIHMKDFTDYSKDLTKEQLIEYLDGNISTNYNDPCNVRKQNEKWLRDVGLSDSAIYHCAGDSIIVTCLMALFGQITIGEDETKHKIKEYVKSIVERKKHGN